MIAQKFSVPVAHAPAFLPIDEDIMGMFVIILMYISMYEYVCIANAIAIAHSIKHRSGISCSQGVRRGVGNVKI